jgi:hypothetical protein
MRRKLLRWRVPDRSAGDDLVAGGPHVGMKELPATAICGNDITSSCLYVSALALVYAGRWAPVALLMVAGVLYLFRSIYAEVIGALPLNTTSKFRASLAACLTVLSCMATSSCRRSSSATERSARSRCCAARRPDSDSKPRQSMR